MSSKSTRSSARSQTILPPREGKKRCCTWPVIIVITVILLGTAGVLIWQFAPINEAVNNVLDELGAPTLPPAPTSSPPPPPSPPTAAPTYQFGSCTSQEDCCNGLDTICDLKVNEVLFAGTHNSYASQDTGFPLFFRNHEKKLEEQLEAGVRGINLDICGCDNELVLCHNSCGTKRSITTVLGHMVEFLNNNPTDILLVTIEINSGVDQVVNLSGIHSIMQGVPGFLEYLYAHPDVSTEWPTLRELKAMGKRMLLFHYNGQTCADGQAFPCPDGLHYWWDHAFETSFEFTTVSDITGNYPASCAADRGRSTNAFFGINHFTGIPLASSAETLGEGNLLRTRLDECATANSLRPISLLQLDFWSKSDLIDVVQEHNRVWAERRLVVDAE